MVPICCKALVMLKPEKQFFISSRACARHLNVSTSTFRYWSQKNQFPAWMHIELYDHSNFEHRQLKTISEGTK